MDVETVWLSHKNPIATPTPEDQWGTVFGPDHEMWKNLQEGDSIGVRVCAQFPGWANHAERGILQIDEWFDPISPSHLPDGA